MIDGNIAALNKYLDDVDKYEKSLIKCEQCEEGIQDDHYYLINGEVWCEECINDARQWTEDYEGE